MRKYQQLLYLKIVQNASARRQLNKKPPAFGFSLMPKVRAGAH